MPKQKPGKLIIENVPLMYREIFSPDYFDADKILSDIKSNNKGGLRTESRNRINSLLSYIRELKQKANNDLGVEATTLGKLELMLIKIMRDDTQYWDERRKLLDEEAVELAQKGLALVVATEEEVERAYQEREKRWRILLLLEEAEKVKLRLLDETQELMRKSQEQLKNWLDEREKLERKVQENNKLLDQYEGRFNGLKNEIKAGGLLDKIKADNPQILPQKIDDAFDKYSIKSGKRFNQFAEDIGISSSRIDRYIRETNLQDKVGEMDNLVDSHKIVSKENESITSQISQGDRDSLKSLINTVILLGAESTRKVDDYLTGEADLIKKLPSELFTQTFDQMIEKASDLNQELSRFPMTKEMLVKRHELNESKQTLISELENLLLIFERRFDGGKTSKEYTIAKAQLDGLKRGEVSKSPLEPESHPELEPRQPLPPPQPNELEENHKLLGAKIEALNKSLGELDDALDAVAMIEDDTQREQTSNKLIVLQEKIKEALVSCGPSQLATLSLDKTRAMLTKLEELEKKAQTLLSAQTDTDEPQPPPGDHF